MISRQCQCLIVTLVLYTVIFEEVSAGLGAKNVIKSKNENMRDPGTYIIRFEENTTDAQLQNFVKQLITMSKKSTNKSFKAEIIAKYFEFNLLTVRLSEKALQWVRIQLSINYSIAIDH